MRPLSLIAAIGFFSLASGVVFAAETTMEYGPLPAQEQAALPEASNAPIRSTVHKRPDELATLTEAQGRVDAIDAANREVRIINADDQPVVVQIPAGTPISTTDNHDLTLTELRPDDEVRIYYSRVDGRAQQVDRLPSVGQQLLGIQ